MHTRFVERPEAELATAIRDCAAGDEVAGVLVLAATDRPLPPSALNPVLESLPVPVFGGLFPGILFEGTRYSEGAVIVSLHVDPTVTVVTDLSDPDTDIRPQLNDSVAMPEETTAFVFVDGYASRIGTFIERLFESYGVECRFLGGGAGTLSTDQTPCLLTNDGLLTDAAVLATLETPSSLGVRHGYRDVDGPFRVNRAEGSTLSMLGDESAFRVYRRVIEDYSGMELTRENFYEVAKSYPFGISRLHDEKIVRDPFTVSTDGSITCFGGIPEGEYLHVLTGDRDSLVSAAREATRAAKVPATDQPLFAFDCISRALYLDTEFDVELEAIGGRDEPAVGALTVGEIANGEGGHLQFYNKTAVVAHIETV